MEETKLFDKENGLIKTKLNGLTINIYTVTEEEVNSFGNYSFGLQISFALFSLSLGGIISVLPSYETSDISKAIFYVCFAVSILTLFSFLLILQQFNKTKKNLFKRAEENIKIGRDEPTLQVLKAIYGTLPTNSIDVTDKVSSMVIDNKLSFIVSNKIIPNGIKDPQVGVRKPLTIKYDFNGTIYTKNYIEKNVVNIP